MTFGYTVSVIFLSSSALMVAFAFVLGYLNYIDNKPEDVAAPAIVPVPVPAA